MRCEANLYVAEWYALRSNRRDAITLFGRARDVCIPGRNLESIPAEKELKQMQTASVPSKQGRSFSNVPFANLWAHRLSHTLNADFYVCMASRISAMLLPFQPLRRISIFMNEREYMRSTYSAP